MRHQALRVEIGQAERQARSQQQAQGGQQVLQEGRAAREQDLLRGAEVAAGGPDQPEVGLERPPGAPTEVALVDGTATDADEREVPPAHILHVRRAGRARQPDQYDVVAPSRAIAALLQGVLADRSIIRRQPVHDVEKHGQGLGRTLSVIRQPYHGPAPRGRRGGRPAAG